MADVGSVQRLFSRKGVIEVAKKQDGKTLSEDDLLEATIDAEPEDITDQGEGFTITSDPNNLVAVRQAVQAAGLDYDSAEVAFVPSFAQDVTDIDGARKLYKLIDALEDLDDVQNVYANDNIAPEIDAALDEE
jgi:transcriptional/translational regulatory protein YebC/TACO1